MKNLILALFLFAPLVGLAQPKMHLKAWIGGNSHTFNYRAEDLSSDFIYGWQGGFGFRIRQDRIFGEVDFSFIRFQANVPFDIEVEPDSIVRLETSIRFNSFELPILAGYVPIKTPLFKWYLQTGLVNRFNVKERVTVTLGEESITETFKPREAGLLVYNLYWRIGTQVDIAMINIGFNYSLNISNGIQGATRTNIHVLLLDVGIIF
jgi:hypothetical protein